MRKSLLVPTVALAIILAVTAPVQADHTPDPSSVTIAGSFQSELGCPNDWQTDCAVTHLTFDTDDGVWQGTFSIPAGVWEYMAAIDDSWDESYGADAEPAGNNLSLSLGTGTDVKFYYDHKTHWVADDMSKLVATVAGDFQSELGCPGDWQPWCLQSWLQDPDGDGVYTLSTGQLLAGSYDAKVAHNEDWSENYGVGGVPGGANIPFTVPDDYTDMFFEYDPVTHLLTISVGSETDGDSDGFGVSVDCDDTDPAINPDADEVCDDGIDNDCDGDIDADDSDCSTAGGGGGGKSFLSCGTLSTPGGPSGPGAVEFALLAMMLIAAQRWWQRRAS